MDANRGLVGGRLFLAGHRRWQLLPAVDVLNVAEVLVVEEIRHASAIGTSHEALPHVDASVPFGTAYGYVQLPYLPVDADGYDPEADPLFGGAR